MVGVDDLVEVVLGGTGWGVALLATSAAVMIAGPHAKPLAKQVMKGYIAANHKVREAAAEAVEQVQDLYAEAKYEFEAQLEAPEVVASAAAPVVATATEPTPRGRTAPATTEVQPA